MLQCPANDCARDVDDEKVMDCLINLQVDCQESRLRTQCVSVIVAAGLAFAIKTGKHIQSEDCARP